MLARTVRAGVAAVCSLGLGVACLGVVGGCSSAFAGGDSQVARSSQVAQVDAALSAASEDAASSRLDAGSSSGDASSAADGVVSSSSSSVTYADGTYHATGRGGKFGGVPVTVVIKEGRITSVTLGANSETDAMAEKARAVVVPQILESQGVEDIDSATGATLTSAAIVDGVAQALERASG